MLEIHYLSVVVAAVAAYVMSSIWYTIFANLYGGAGSAYTGEELLFCCLLRRQFRLDYGDH